MIVGISGKYCAGKSTVAAILEKRGFYIIDADRLGHKALETAKDKVVERFGDGILLPDGTVDRKRLGAIVFADRKALKDLEAISHPEIRRMAVELVEKYREKQPLAIDAALLFAIDFPCPFDCIIWVKAPFLYRVRRSRKRDGLPFVQLLKRIWAQRKLAPKSSTAFVDMYTVINKGDMHSLEVQIDQILRKEVQV